MGKYHFNWDKPNNNGVIYNDTYNGCMIRGNELAPQVSFEYDKYGYSEIAEGPNYVFLDGIVRDMTEAEEQEVRNIAINWVQPEGQECNLSLEQKKKLVSNRAAGLLNATLNMVSHLSRVLTSEEFYAIKIYREWLREQMLNPDYPMDYPIDDTLQSAGAKFGLTFSNDLGVDLNKVYVKV